MGSAITPNYFENHFEFMGFYEELFKEKFRLMGYKITAEGIEQLSIQKKNCVIGKIKGQEIKFNIIQLKIIVVKSMKMGLLKCVNSLNCG